MAGMADTKKAVPDDLNVAATDEGLNHLQNAGLHDKALANAALEATVQEHQLGVFEALKTYKRAAFWSILISTTVIMEGYDVTLLGSFYGYPSFREKYGEWLDDTNGYQISATWQQRFNCLGALANIIGALLNGWATAKWGHRKVLMVSLVLLTGFIFIVFFAPSIEIMLVGQFFCNIPWGVFATTGPAYAAEVTPLAIRGYLTAYVNLCWCIGQFISAGVLKGLVNNPTKWSYKVPFAIQWIWPIPLFIAAWLAPESPWFLVRNGKLDQARHSLARLSEPEHNVNLDDTIAMMVHTNKLEIEEREGVSYWDAFRGTNRRRTEIACMGFLSQITNGGALCYSGSFFFQQTGLSPDASYGISLGGTGIAFVGTIVSWFYIYRWGRRTIWLIGFSSLVIILWTIGFLSLPKQTLGLAWGQSILCIVWLGAYSMSVGPIIYTLVAEIGSTRLRTQTVVLARSTYYVGNIICGGLLQPKLISPGAWNAKGKTAFFWAGLATLTLIWGYFRLFETKDRTFGEMDFMFQKNVSARQSAKYQVNEDEVYAAEEMEQK
ncbi:alpha-glucosides permease MPH2/3 [Purpureocillium lavendulum]|uniref:Alpha-glucosides permease MPH2/3 n=1 Tax=Purpureocillium lavendulum TaxID=1247861 RepID=A0AB34FGK2_9HYPO|nr:alpha-glucosides permease MPH2/3 [Purpureocillium lavendulum]